MNLAIDDTRNTHTADTSGIQTNPRNTSADEGISQMFVDLLVAQVTHQNPLSPMDGTAYASQLAEFSNVENLSSLNQQMAQQIAMTQSAQALHAASLLGQEGALTQSALSLETEADVKGSLRLPEGTHRVEVQLQNANGEVIGSKSYDADGQHELDFSFGLQEAGNYHVTAVAVNGTQRQDLAVRMQGTIEQIRMGDGSQAIEVLMQGVGWVNLLDLQDLRRPA